MPYDSRMHGYCLRCKNPGRNKCIKLCDQAEHYANQDYISQRERLMCDVGSEYSSELELPYIGDLIESFGPLEWNMLRAAGIPDLEIKMLQLFHIEGKSYKEIANIMSGGHIKRGLGENACRVRLQRVRTKLRAFFSIVERENNNEV